MVWARLSWVVPGGSFMGVVEMLMVEFSAPPWVTLVRVRQPVSVQL